MDMITGKTPHDLIEEVIDYKRGLDIERYMCHFCPDTPNEFLSNDAIMEGRGRGISIYSLADCRNKIVISPEDLGYNYDYMPYRGTWGTMSAFNFDTIESNEKIIAIGLYLRSQNYDVWLVHIGMDGKGYSWSSIYELKEDMIVPNDPLVLFVFTNSPINDLLNGYNDEKGYSFDVLNELEGELSLVLDDIKYVLTEDQQDDLKAFIKEIMF